MGTATYSPVTMGDVHIRIRTPLGGPLSPFEAESLARKLEREALANYQRAGYEVEVVVEVSE